ncbi:bifunctional dTDP-4-dehydrorhamnose 3,5-epimerase family protein/NAD(P)-dependent oxidoreductase [Christensenellaceae bacterium OttesenSCG-928-L17]|nr:bifunctional dTDP-4-dehydrorhamnose 3,5-epimerase family protein/NAD(P)-dependent oxidoreductase [Christensenellaceae bacterium OttesenSCG-928-L17]
MQREGNNFEFGHELRITKTEIPGLLVIDLPVHGDSRGWFKENWQRAKMVELGLPDFQPVQNNISFNSERGVTRGLHAEPWDKFISVATGKVFGAWVDLRAGDNFGKVFSIEITPNRAIFVPKGVANGYQALAANTAYSYLVNEHWHVGVKYTAVSLSDETINIKWPIKLSEAIISDKDQANPKLEAVEPIQPAKILITGGNGQLGLALRSKYPEARWADRDSLDIANMKAIQNFDWSDIGTVINAAAYTNVDGAESEEGRELSWCINAVGVSNLAKICKEKNITLFHISSDYVFDGRKPEHDEEESPSPLSVYGASKAAGDLIVSSIPKHYTLRTSWVIGEGKNFVRTMIDLGRKGISPKVVDDQRGRLTFTSELVSAIDFILSKQPAYGTYNVTNSGPIASWAEITEKIFDNCGYNLKVERVSTEEYFAGKTGIAPRPKNSDLNLEKLQKQGFLFSNWEIALKEYIKKETRK